ncbi:MAG: ribulose-phosphate 3-epimerase [Thermoleophilia bacterium]|nr:ribulose-phosphate 3-epimerase [Thermoleophilia bacterium]
MSTDTNTADRARELFATTQILPSILSADFARLGEQVAAVMDAGARVIHVDVMDGHFVPPITIGPLIVEALADQVHDAGGVLDVHLMIEDPARQVDAFARAGADAISFHVEATPHAHRVAGQIREAGVLAGIVLNPGTSVDAIAGVASRVDFALCMSVNPGWGGQKFIPASIERLRRLRELLPDGAALEVDGGVDQGTAPQVAGAGANLLVAGSAIFGRPDPAAAYRAIAAAAGG